MHIHNGCVAYSKKTVKKIKEEGGEVLLCVKKNQKGLYKTCQKTFEKMEIAEEYTECDQGHGRGETRHIEVYDQIEYFNGKTEYYWGEYIKKVFKVQRIRMHFRGGEVVKQSFQEEYYLSTMDMGVQKLNEGVRGHWSIENKNHYVKDETMREDKSRIRIKAGNFARLRSFGLNLMKYNKKKNINRESYKNCLNIDNILRFKGLTS